ncbi:COP9 signalosome complex subunit 5 [Purpureocillium lavendulum]|uniref:COP9 signalosome complex subunit 5 n=1 Tax=Purpureocillium lavendulum TaxID=1247861 RepID=A0AB34FS17_9HYPO|nr:COP9 signalosome complex subunit 5 [Purpureocillium lavendulum]
MSKRNVGMIAAAGAAVIGVGLYSNTSRKEPSSQAGPGRNQAQAKRGHGLSGAGVGGNMMTGGTELEASPGRFDKDPEQKTGTTAPPSKLPSGGVGGGEGAGGSSARKMQVPTVGNQSPDTNATGLNSNSAQQSSSEQPGVLGSIQGFLGQGGKKTEENLGDSVVHNTRGISQMGSEVPSKKKAPPNASN